MSALTLLNRTPYPAQFIVGKGEQIVAQPRSVAPGGQMRVPTHDLNTVTAIRPETPTSGTTYLIRAVINGVTTDAVQTTNANAVVTAVPARDDADRETGYYALEVA